MSEISVIIPVYKIEKYIKRCLESVINQSFSNYEIILVDDCGGDDSIHIAEDFLKSQRNNIPYKIVAHENNRGLSAARNTGIRVSRCPYVYFLDGDDTITPDCLKILIEAFKNNPEVDMAMAGMTRRFPTEDSSVTHHSSCVITGTDNIIREFINNNLIWNAVNRLIPRSFFIDNGLYFTDGVTSEDMLWNFEILPCLNKIAIAHDRTYIYYVTAESITNSQSLTNCKLARDFISIIAQMEKSVSRYPRHSYIQYYHYIKYDFISKSLLWRRYPSEIYDEIYGSLLNNRLHDYYAHLPIRHKMLFLFPKGVILKLKKLSFRISIYSEIAKHRKKKLIHFLKSAFVG